MLLCECDRCKKTGEVILASQFTQRPEEPVRYPDGWWMVRVDGAPQVMGQAIVLQGRGVLLLCSDCLLEFWKWLDPSVEISAPDKSESKLAQRIVGKAVNKAGPGDTVDVLVGEQKHFVWDLGLSATEYCREGNHCQCQKRDCSCQCHEGTGDLSKPHCSSGGVDRHNMEPRTIAHLQERCKTCGFVRGKC